MNEIRPSVSLTLIARDEDAHIERCLKSASGLAEEMTVVDTGSSNRTKKNRDRVRGEGIGL